jgi:hypothetical protein
MMSEAKADKSEIIGEPVTRIRTMINLSDEERERPRQRMRDYWSKKRAMAAETSDPTESSAATGKSGITHHA